jgi:GT2 family glycosyltransferase
LDNTEREFQSAAQALNYGGKKAIGKYIMFVHQDVDLCSNTWLEEAEKMLEPISGLGIAGVAGMCENEDSNGKRGRNIIKHGKPEKFWSLGTVIQKPEPVQTLDECLVIIPKSMFDIFQFDEKICIDWHMYAVDYCLSVQKEGLGVYAIPMFIYHKSTGATIKGHLKLVLSMGCLPHGYYHTLDKLLKKHKTHVKQIYTTVDNWNTSYPLIMQRIQKLARRGMEYLIRRLKRNSQK